MFRESVAQNPTMAVSCGMKTRQKSAAVANFEPEAKSERGLPVAARTLIMAQTRSASPETIRNGAAQDSSHLIELIPCQTKWRLMSQKARKHTPCQGVRPRAVMWLAMSDVVLIHPSPPR